MSAFSAVEMREIAGDSIDTEETRARRNIRKETVRSFSRIHFSVVRTNFGRLASSVDAEYRSTRVATQTRCRR